MPETSADHMIDIDKKLKELPPIPSERCIFRVHDQLRNESKKAYEPEVVAIGPYHHGKDNLKPMEEHKLRYLQQLLQRRNETSAERYIVAMRESEPRARKLLQASFSNPREDDIEHLLGLLHYCCCCAFHSMVSQRNIVEIKDKSLKSTKGLQEAGIKFKKVERRNLFDIKFVNGTLEIPTLEVEDDTESVFRNLIAYEQYSDDTSWQHFTAYHKFMDYLVNTSKDVEILTDCGIIHSLLGEDEVVATMLNKLGNNIIISHVGYEEVYNKVNEHCRGKWNTRFATLRRDYFNTPWAFISFLAAVVLLLLTVLQTIFTIHPFGKFS